MYSFKKHIFVTIGCVLLCGMAAMAQQGDNPFELSGRTDPTTTEPPSTSTTPPNPFDLSSNKDTVADDLDTDQTTKAAANNPFEIGNDLPIANDQPPSANDTNSTKLANPFDLPEFNRIIKSADSQKEKDNVLPTRPASNPVTMPESLSSTFKLWLLIGLLTMLTLIVTFYSDVLIKIYRSFLNNNFLRMIHRDQDTAVAIPYMIFYTFALASIGIFVFVLLNHYGIPLFGSHLKNMMACIAGVFALFTLKHLVLRIIGFVFPIQKEVSQYRFTIIIFMTILGLVLLPASIFIAYAPANMTTGLIYTSFGIIFLVYAYRILSSLLMVFKHISLHPFHFFVYLCTVEIAPLLVLFKLSGAL